MQTGWSWMRLHTVNGSVGPSSVSRTVKICSLPIPLSARRTMSGILFVTKPAPIERMPRTATPPMNANSIGAMSGSSDGWAGVMGTYLGCRHH